MLKFMAQPEPRCEKSEVGLAAEKKWPRVETKVGFSRRRREDENREVDDFPEQMLSR